MVKHQFRGDLQVGMRLREPRCVLAYLRVG